MITYAELLAMCEGNIDVAVDASSRELDLVLERLRSLGPDGRARLRWTLTGAIEAAAADVQQARATMQARRREIDRWYERRAVAAAAAPALVSEVDLRIAELERDDGLELREYQATLDTLQRALSLVDAVHDAAR